jgi:SAM-dependent methyltransferase
MNRADALYQGTSGRKYHEQKRALRPEALEWVMSLRAEKFRPYVSPDDVVFELGVGSGWNLGRLGCGRRIGCDTSEFLAERVSELGIEFVTSTAALPSSIAEVVICHHTLEHLIDPAAALKDLARILKPQGKLLLTTPWERERRFALYQADDSNHHLFNWNPQNLGNLVALLGFQVRSVTTRRYGYDRFAANLALRLRCGAGGYRLLRACLIAIRPLIEVQLIALK